jgi:ankyrin repeat protein
VPQQAYHADLEDYADRAYGLLESARDGTPSAVAAFAGAPATIDAARASVARAHGCEDWDALCALVEGLEASGAPFAAAYRAIEAHDPDALAAVLERAPEVARQEGTNGNDLLAMATATCDDRTVALLLEHGADPNHQNAHGWSAMHQIGYSNSVHLAPALLAAGGRTDVSGRGDGGTPLVAALFWGHREIADALVGAGGVQPRNLRAAAGAGDTELIAALAGTPEAGAHRGFYRPHSGFPHWTPGEDPQEVLDEALSYAARAGRIAAIDALIDSGARPGADVYRGTALVWAAVNGHVDAVRRLLVRGADPQGLSTFGGESHGEAVTALHFAANVATAQVLLDAGADPTLVDGHGYGPPAGWARHDGRDEVAALLDSYAA